MAKQESGLRVTRSLQKTLLDNPLIKEVYFDENGGHYFTKHKTKIHKTDDMNRVVSVEEVECLPGAKRAIVMEKKTVNGFPTYKGAMRNVSYTPIAAAFTREEILKATPVSDIRTEKEKLEYLRIAAEIAKEDDIEGLLQKLNKK